MYHYAQATIFDTCWIAQQALEQDDPVGPQVPHTSSDTRDSMSIPEGDNRGLAVRRM
jgi:hypothetical protein